MLDDSLIHYIPIFPTQIVIIDFGLAKRMTAQEVLNGIAPCPRGPVGTDGYKAPEMMRGEVNYG